MDVTTPYTLLTSAYLTLQALPLALTPTLLISMINPSDPRRATDLEIYLSRALGLSLLTLAGTILPLTGVLPVGRISDADTAGKVNPYVVPTVVVTTAYHALSAFYLYTNLTWSWNFCFSAGIFFSGLLFFVGMWVLVFGDEATSRSKRTGADKRTGNFPFTNVESAREKKKEGKSSSSDKEGKSSGRKSMARTKSRE